MTWRRRSEMFSVKFVVTLLMSLTNVVVSQDVLNTVTRTMFINMLLDEYDNAVTPTFDSKSPTLVNVSLHINGINSVNEQTMDFSMNVFVTQSWYDDRLVFHDLIDSKHLELDSKVISRFWVPDLYFVNEKKSEVHGVTVPNALLHLHSDGKVVYKLRITLTATCLMALHKFPMDDQTCSLYMKSFGYSGKSLQFQWSKDKPITRHPKLAIAQFSLAGLNHGYCHEVEENDTFTCLAMNLQLTRGVGFYILHLYIPSTLIVAISWVSFCLDAGCVPARVTLGILTVLTMTNMKTLAVSSLPKVSYIKAIDVWMAVCLTFVFLSLLEFALVNTSARRMVSSDVAWKLTVEVEPLQQQTKVNNRRPSQTYNDKPAVNKVPDPKGMIRASQIDKFSLVFFPVSFTIFIISYVLWYW